ncbi:hypothetical protein F8796_22170, partial [Salmonella enterica]|nr:hypothetical protein [Salmonella enterica]
MTDKGFVQLSSSTGSLDETMAATPKAVRIAMDNANARLAKERNLADLTNIPLARQSLQLGNSATRNVGATAGTVAAGDDSRITGALQKDQNGADIPNKPLFLQNVGLTETVKQAAGAVPSTRKINNHALDKDLSLTPGDIGALPVTGGKLNGPLGIGTDNALGGNSIVFGDNDTGFKWHSDGVLGIYANNALVGYIDNSGLHMSVDVLTNGAVRAGDGKKLSLTSNNNSTMTATFNLWGDANRPTVIELDDDQGWHLCSQRNPDGSIVFTVNGDITANTLRAGAVGTLGDESNPVQLISAAANQAADNFVAWTSYTWYQDYVRTGVVRAGDTTIKSFAVEINGVRFLEIGRDGTLLNGNMASDLRLGQEESISM